MENVDNDDNFGFENIDVEQNVLSMQERNEIWTSMKIIIINKYCFRYKTVPLNFAYRKSIFVD